MDVESLVRSNVYYDSLILLQISSKLLRSPGVHQAVVMMGTDENKASIKNKQLMTESVRHATPNDLIVVVAAESRAEAKEAIDFAIGYLEAQPTPTTQEVVSYKTLEAAIRSTPGANLAFISLPGRYAAAEARQAIEAGLHVFLFSDNVPLDQEIELKRLATSKNLLLMGPDCGTAILGGAALGFANAVRRGPIGIIGASGTGIQEIASLIHRLGSGVSLALGTGTRDVSAAVGGVTLTAGIEWMVHDPQTEVIVIVSKPPSPAVTKPIQEIIERCSKPFVVNMLGSTAETFSGNDVSSAETLEDAALMAVSLSQSKAPGAVRSKLYNEREAVHQAQSERSRLRPGQKYFRGLFSGGTFANESAMLLVRHLQDVYGNLSLPGVKALENPLSSLKHTCVDMGDDVFTVGKPHPILAPNLRHDRLLAEAADPTTGVIYVDIVLGYGVHPDPAAEFADYIQEAQSRAASEGRYLPVIVNVCGVDEDPQNRGSQLQKLRQSGALIAPTNAAATRLAIGILTGNFPETSPTSVARVRHRQGEVSRGLPFNLPNRANVINIGLIAFADSLKSQGVPVTHVDFHPPAGGNQALVDLLSEML